MLMLLLVKPSLNVENTNIPVLVDQPSEPVSQSIPPSPN